MDWPGRKQTSVCKPNCKPTVQHSMIRDITNRDHRIINAKSEHTLNHWTAQANTRILELESRCAVIRTVVRIPPSPPALLVMVYLSGALLTRPPDRPPKIAKANVTRFGGVGCDGAALGP